MKLLKLCFTIICFTLLTFFVSCKSANKIYFVTLDYNNDSGQTEKITLKTQGVRKLPTKIINDKYVSGWYVDKELTTVYDENNQNDLTVYAKWETMEKVLYQYDKSKEIVENYVVISDESSSIHGRDLVIKPSCYVLELNDISEVDPYFSIEIEDRDSDFFIILNNFKGYGNLTEQDVIFSSSNNFTLNIENRGESKIQGRTKSGNVINCPNVNIYGEGKLSLYGSIGTDGNKGSDGADGEHGEKGGTGGEGGSGIKANNVTIKNINLEICGGTGGIGGTGGNGNNGAFDKHKNGGTGGKGGTGGIGGTGGRGGGETKSYAGEGGTGGTGGTGGYGVICSSCDSVDSIVEVLGGSGGDGGQGGISRRTDSSFLHQAYDYSGEKGSSGASQEKYKIIQVVNEKKWYQRIFSCNNCK